MKKLLAFILVLLVVPLMTVGDEVRTGTGTTTGALPGGDPPVPQSTVPSVICVSPYVVPPAPGGYPMVELVMGNVGPGPEIQFGLPSFVIVDYNPPFGTDGDPADWTWECKGAGGTVDYSTIPGGAPLTQQGCSFTCGDVGAIDPLEMWATNTIGSDFCGSAVLVSDPFSACGP